MIFDLTGAAASRAFAGHGAVTIVIPLALAAAALGSWGNETIADARGADDLFVPGTDPPAPRSGLVVAVDRSDVLVNAPIQSAPGTL